MKQSKEIRIIAEIAVLVSVAIVLDVIFGILSKGIFPWGGSISPAMLPIFIVAYRHGIKTGLFTGFIFAVVQLFVGGMVGSDVAGLIPETEYFGPTWLKVIMMYLLDYIIPFTLLGIVGIFKNALRNLKTFILGMVLAAFIRYLAHGFSGVLIWGSYAEWFNEEYGTNVSPFVYSFFIYNPPYMVGSLIFCIAVGYVLFKRNLLTINLDKKD